MSFSSLSPIIITGPTATGKTDLALQLAREKDGYLINSDSRQLYQGIDIISGKDLPLGAKFHLVKTLQIEGLTINLGFYQFITDNKLSKIDIWLYDALPLTFKSSPTIWVRLVNEVLTLKKESNQTPIIVGGTGYYLRQLLDPPATSVIPFNSDLRNNIKNLKLEDLQKMLQSESMELWEKLNNSERNNSQRLIRKIEIAKYILTKLHLHDYTNPKYEIENYESRILPLPKDRESYRRAIEARVRQRLKLGAIDEVESLINANHLLHEPGMQTLGVKEIANFLEGEINEETLIASWTTSEYHYALRQELYFKKYLSPLLQSQ